MKITRSSDWRDSLPFDVPVIAADAVPGDPTRCATCGVGSEPRDRSSLWAVKHRHPNNPAGFVRFYCSAHAPKPAPAPTQASRTRTPERRRAPARPAREEKPAALCPNCFVEVPATGVCGMCGQPVS